MVDVIRSEAKICPTEAIRFKKYLVWYSRSGKIVSPSEWIIALVENTVSSLFADAAENGLLDRRMSFILREYEVCSNYNT